MVRAAGGHQVGHTVRLEGYSHTFSNFGSGTLRGVPTWYAAGTTIFPPGMAAEAKVLGERRTPLFIHPLAMVATPWDIAWNRAFESIHRHGSCGVGYGATVERCRAGISLAVKDIDMEWVFAEKLKGIRAYYQKLATTASDAEMREAWERETEGLDDGVFIHACQEARGLWSTKTLQEALAGRNTLVFEGNQGILLDEIEGIYPHVSWGRTTSRPALELLAGIRGRVVESIEVLYVTRCYQTRHGAGPMSSKGRIELLGTVNESNHENAWQGPFRIAELDVDLLRWALMTDMAYQDGFVDEGGLFHQEAGRGEDVVARCEGCPIERSLVVTCLDQRPGFNVHGMVDALGMDFRRVWGSYSPESKDFSIIRDTERARETMKDLAERR